MKGAAVALLVACLVAATPALADTRTGNVNPNKDFFYEVVSFFGGQMNATVTWQKKSAQLFMVMACSDGITTLEWGIAASQQDRVQRLDVGVLGGLTCVIGVASFSGKSKFALNVQETSDADPLAVQARATRTVPPPYAEVSALIAKTRAVRSPSR